jgi:hypothetical protein
MWATAVLASALVRPAVLLTAAVPGGYGGGDGEGGGGDGGGGEGEGGGGEGERGSEGGEGGGGGGGEKMRTSARLRMRFVPGSTMVT